MCRSLGDQKIWTSNIAKDQFITFLEDNRDDPIFALRFSLLTAGPLNDSFISAAKRRSGTSLARKFLATNTGSRGLARLDYLDYLIEKYNAWYNAQVPDSASIANIADSNKRIFGNLRRGADCNQIREVPYIIKVEFDGGRNEYIFPIEANRRPATSTQDSYYIRFIKDTCIRTPLHCPGSSAFAERRINSDLRSGHTQWSNLTENHGIKRMTRESMTACDIQHFTDQVAVEYRRSRNNSPLPNLRIGPKPPSSGSRNNRGVR